jgi:peptidoglycan lytic transglycosylase A
MMLTGEGTRARSVRPLRGDFHRDGTLAPSSVSPSAKRGGLPWRPRVGALLALTLASCAYLPAPLAPSPVSSEPHLIALDAAECRAVIRDDATARSLQQAIARSVDYLEGLPPDRVLPVLDRSIAAGELAAMLRDVGGAEQVCDRFRLYRAELPQGLLVTGYYQPELPARRTRSDRFRYPLYRIPDNLVEADLTQFCPACSGRVIQGRVQGGQLVPYYSRAEIDDGALVGRGYEIAWLDDPVEAYFLHVQGSALLHFDDGVQMQISYAGSNGRPYTSLGRAVIDQGKMDRDAVSLQSLKDYLRAHPDEQAPLMEANQRYIFFRPVINGPIGSIGVPLTAGRSIAADAGVYPRGGLAFVRVRPRDVPQSGNNEAAFSRFVLIQDAGTAITGAGRIDMYIGTGSTAEGIAGDLRNPGELYIVLP